MSFRNRLIISLIVLLIPLIISDIYFHYRQYRSSREMALNMQMDAASDLAKATDVFVDRTVAVQRSVGLALVSSHWRSANIRQSYLESVLRSTPYLRQIGFADPSGTVRDGAPQSVVGFKVDDRSYFREILQGADWAVSNLIISKADRRPGFVIATGIRDEQGLLLGVVFSGIDESKMVSVIHTQCRRGNMLVLVDTQGRVTMACNNLNLPYSQRQWQQYPFVQAALRGKHQSIERLNLPGRPELMGGMVPVSAFGWTAGVFTPREHVIGPIRSMAYRDAFETLLIVLLTVFIGTVIALQMTRPIGDLSDAAERLEEGHLGTRTNLPGIIELDTLAHTMNRMAESIQRRDEELRQAYERERRIASVLQQRMLPQVPPIIGCLELATGYFPALAEAELGGDFYDVIILPDGFIAIVIADVSGKGLTAAVHTAMMKYMLEGFACENPNPARVLSRLNHVLCVLRQEDTDIFVTVSLVVVNTSTGEFVYSTAGHPPPLLRRIDGTTAWLNGTPGVPLCMFDTYDYEGHNGRLSDGDSLLLYTDGVIEAHHEGRWFDMESLETFVRSANMPPAQMVDAVRMAASDAIAGQITDDIALVVARFVQNG